MATTAPISGLEFDALPYEEGRQWELLDGELLPMSSTTPKHQIILNRLLVPLGLHTDAKPGQGVAMSDIEFALEKDYRLRPDPLVPVGSRATALDLDKVPVPGAPDIAVEIISPSERAVGTQARLEASLRFGAQQVWQIYPKSKSVVIHRRGSGAGLALGECITTPLLPGFSLDTKALF